MKNVAHICGFIASLFSTGALIVMWWQTHGVDRVIITVAGSFAILNLILSTIAYLFPTGKDYELLAKERTDREAKHNEKERYLRLRKEEDERRRHMAETRRLEAEANMAQLHLDEERQRLQRNTLESARYP